MNTRHDAYGVIVVYKDTDDYKFLLLLQNPQFEGDTNWTFPKGHGEEGEDPKDSALRELYEETGVKDIEIVEDFLFHEEYITPKGNFKTNNYFIGFVKTKDVKIQEDEISDYRWCTYKEALNLFTKEKRKNTLIKANQYLNKLN